MSLAHLIHVKHPATAYPAMSSAAKTLLVNFVQAEELPQWRDFFGRALPDLHVALWDDHTVEPESVHYALVWKPEPGRLARFPNLRVIISEGAGVDHITGDPLIPLHIPVTRMVTHETSARMADYVTMAAYMLLRQIPQIIEAQRQRQWANHLTGRLASDTRVGILGLGNLGAVVAQRLLANGFTVNGWSRRDKHVSGVNGFSGAQQLNAFLRSSDILVNLLPDTRETRGLINHEVLSQLPRGAGVINAGRGPQLDSDALLRALDSGQVQAAVLDVFEQEPLPKEHPLWQHPRVIITSHVASLISSQAKAQHAIAVINADRAGLPLPLLYNREQGY